MPQFKEQSAPSPKLFFELKGDKTTIPNYFHFESLALTTEMRKVEGETRSRFWCERARSSVLG